MNQDTPPSLNVGTHKQDQSNYFESSSRVRFFRSIESHERHNGSRSEDSPSYRSGFNVGVHGWSGERIREDRQSLWRSKNKGERGYQKSEELSTQLSLVLQGQRQQEENIRKIYDIIEPIQTQLDQVFQGVHCGGNKASSNYFFPHTHSCAYWYSQHYRWFSSHG